MIGRWARNDAALSASNIVLSLVALLTAVIGCGLLGRIDQRLGLTVAGALFALTALLFPRLGLALLVMIAPIQGLWGLSRQDMPTLLAVLMVAINLRHLDAWWRLCRPRGIASLSPLLTTLAIFIALYLLRGLPSLPAMPEEQLRAAGREAAFLLLLFGAAMATARRCAEDNGDALRLGMIGAVVLALLLTLAFDVVAVYFPALSRDLHLLPEWQGLRLAGLHANPNATAKFLVAGEAFALAACWRLTGLDGESPPDDAAERWLPVIAMVAVVLAVAIGATLSKASLVGIVAAPLVLALTFWQFRRRRRRRRAVVSVLVSAAVVLGLAVSFDAVLALGLAKQTNQRRMEAEHIVPPPPPEPKRSVAKKPDLVESIGRQLRIAQSTEMVIKEQPTAPVVHSEMYRNIEGAIEYKARDCSGLGCTGQRDRLWQTGLRIWADHWLVGIGPAAWPGEYLGRVRFPFDTPHNVLIELGGGFGVAGLAVYVLLLLALLRALRVFGRPPGGTVATIHARGAVLFAWALLITEWVDPSKFFTMSPHALWLWPLLAGAAGLEAESDDWAGR